jgi:glycerol kinase
MSIVKGAPYRDQYARGAILGLLYGGRKKAVERARDWEEH